MNSQGRDKDDSTNSDQNPNSVWDAVKYKMTDNGLHGLHDTFQDIEEAVQTDKGINLVDALIIGAADNNLELNTVSSIAEDVRVASRATVSRRKIKLEDAGVIDTEQVRVDPGRQRIKLKLPDNHDATKLADILETTQGS